MTDFDSWTADMPDVRNMKNEQVYSDLPQWLIDLRDGAVSEPSSVGLARQQRLAQMETELADCRDFVADCDRYAEYMEHLESPCVHPVVPKMMGRHLREMKGRALHRSRRLREELSILRKQS